MNGRCLNCKTRFASCPRGLCNKCLRNKTVRVRYPTMYEMQMVVASQSLGEPTMAAPGTPEKVAVLEARWGANLALWHPLDARIEET